MNAPGFFSLLETRLLCSPNCTCGQSAFPGVVLLSKFLETARTGLSFSVVLHLRCPCLGSQRSPGWGNGHRRVWPDELSQPCSPTGLPPRGPPVRSSRSPGQSGRHSLSEKPVN